jgi:amidophosphoribosyltransferase
MREKCGVLGVSSITKDSVIDGSVYKAKDRLERTFIMPGQSLRDKMVALKLNVVGDVVEGKRIILVDDSIVRGTTMKRIVRLLRRGGAREVHVRVSCPPIISACYMGIGFTSRKELIAKMMDLDELTSYIGTDSLRFNTVEGLASGIGLPESGLCLACLTGKVSVLQKPQA